MLPDGKYVALSGSPIPPIRNHFQYFNSTGGKDCMRRIKALSESDTDPKKEQ
jgi:hypothetical protein